MSSVGIGSSAESPHFNLYDILGFEPLKTPSLAQELYQEMQGEKQLASSWIKEGHPLGKVVIPKEEEEELSTEESDSSEDSISESMESSEDLEEDELGLDHLVQFSGYSVKHALHKGETLRALQGEEAAPAKAPVNALDYMKKFLASLSKNSQVLNDFNLCSEEIKEMEETFSQASSFVKEFADVLNGNVIAQRDEEEDGEEKLAKVIDQNAEEVASEAVRAATVRLFAKKLVDQLEEKRVLFLPIGTEKNALFLRIDKDHGFSVINAAASPHIAGFGVLGIFTEEEGRGGNRARVTDSYHPLIQERKEDVLTGQVVHRYKMQQFVSFAAEKKERIGDQDFFEALLKGIALTFWERRNESDVTNLVYESLPRYIQGNQIEISEKDHPELFKNVPSADDVSSLKNISTTLYYLFCDPFFAVNKENHRAITSYKKVRFLWESQMFVSYCRKLEQKGEWGQLKHEERCCLEDVMAHLSRFAAKLYQRGGLTSVQLSDFNQTCSEVRAILSRPVAPQLGIGENKIHLSKEENKQSAVLAGLLPVYSGNNIEIVKEIELPQVLTLGGRGGGRVGAVIAPLEDSIPTVQAFVRRLETLGSRYPVNFEAKDNKEIKATYNSFSEIVDVFNTSIGEIEGGISFRNAKESEIEAAFQTLSRAVGDLISKMPMPKRKEKDYWTQIDEETARHYLELCDRLSNLLLQISCEKSSFKGLRGHQTVHDPETTIMLYALYAVMTKIGTRLPEALLPEQPFGHWELISQMRSINFMVKHPGLQTLLHSVLVYFDSSWSLESLKGDFIEKKAPEDFASLLAFKAASFYGTDSGTSFALEFGNNENEMLGAFRKVTGQDVGPSAMEKYLLGLIHAEGDEETQRSVRAYFENENQERDKRFAKSREKYLQDQKSYEEKQTELKEEIEKQKKVIEELQEEKIQAERDLLKAYDIKEEKDLNLFSQIFEARSQLGDWDKIAVREKVEPLREQFSEALKEKFRQQKDEREVLEAEGTQRVRDYKEQIKEYSLKIEALEEQLELLRAPKEPDQTSYFYKKFDLADPSFNFTRLRALQTILQNKNNQLEEEYELELAEYKTEEKKAEKQKNRLREKKKELITEISALKANEATNLETYFRARKEGLSEKELARLQPLFELEEQHVKQAKDRMRSLQELQRKEAAVFSRVEGLNYTFEGGLEGEIARRLPGRLTAELDRRVQAWLDRHLEAECQRRLQDVPNKEAAKPGVVEAIKEEQKNDFTARIRGVVIEEIETEAEEAEELLREKYRQIRRKRDEIQGETAPLLQRKQLERDRLERELKHFPSSKKPTFPGIYLADLKFQTAKYDQIAALLLTEEGKKLVPKSFDKLIQASLRCQYAMVHSDIAPPRNLGSHFLPFEFSIDSNGWDPLPIANGKQQERKRINFSFSVKRKGEEESRLIQSSFVRGSDIIDETLETAPAVKSRKGFSDEWYRRDPDLHHLTTLETNEHNVNGIESQKELGPTTPNKAMVYRGNNGIFDLTNPRDEKELFMLGLDPYDAVSRTVGYFSKHIELVGRPAIQKFIRMQLFRPERIHSQVRISPTSVEAVVRFIETGIKHYKEEGDIDTCLYLIRLGYEMKVVSEKMGCVQGIFPDYRETILKEIVPAFCGSIEEKGKEDGVEKKLKAYRTLVLFHSQREFLSPLSEEETLSIAQDLLAFRVCRAQMKTREEISAEDQAMLSVALLRYRSLIDEVLRTKHNEMLSHALRAASPKIDEEKNWHAEGAFWVDQTREYRINTRSGEITRNGVSLTPTPYWVMNHEILKKVYPEKIEGDPRKVDERMYELNPGTDNAAEVISLDGGETIQVKKLINGHKYRYVEMPSTMFQRMPTLFDDKNQTCWVNDTSSEMLVYQKKKLLYRLVIEPGVDGCVVKKITREWDGYVFADFKEFASVFKGLPLFEQDPHYIGCWMSSDGTNCVVDFKRLDLSFSFDPQEVKRWMRTEGGLGIGRDEKVAAIIKELSDRCQEDVEAVCTSMRTIVQEMVPEIFMPMVQDTLNRTLESLRNYPENARDTFEVFFRNFGLILQEDHINQAYSTIVPSTTPLPALQCQQYPGFVLSKPLLIESLRGLPIPLYLTLEKKGEKKVLVPHVKHVPFQNIRQGLSLNNKISWLEYNVVESKRSGSSAYVRHDVVSNEVDEQISLILLCFLTKDYAKANALLSKVSSTSRFTEEQQRMIAMLCGLFLKEDTHPEAKALVLKLLLLEETNALLFPPTKVPQEPLNAHNVPQAEEAREGEGRSFWERVRPLSRMEQVGFMVTAYLDYLREQSHMGANLLSLEEERRVLEVLYQNIPDFLEKFLQVNNDGDANRLNAGNPDEGFVPKLQREGEVWLKKRLIRVFLGFMDSMMGDRFDDLTKKKLNSKYKSSLGAKSFQPFLVKLIDLKNSTQFDTSFIEPNVLIQSFEDVLRRTDEEIDGVPLLKLEVPTEEKIKETLQALEVNWQTAFVTLYYVARSGSKEDKEELQKKIELTTHSNSKQRKIIKWVLETPRRYPTFEDFNKILRDIRDASVEEEKARIAQAAAEIEFSQADADFVAKKEMKEGLEETIKNFSVTLFDTKNEAVSFRSARKMRAKLASVEGELQRMHWVALDVLKAIGLGFGYVFSLGAIYAVSAVQEEHRRLKGAFFGKTLAEGEIEETLSQKLKKENQELIIKIQNAQAKITTIEKGEEQGDLENEKKKQRDLTTQQAALTEKIGYVERLETYRTSLKTRVQQSDQLDLQNRQAAQEYQVARSIRDKAHLLQEKAKVRFKKAETVRKEQEARFEKEIAVILPNFVYVIIQNIVLPVLKGLKIAIQAYIRGGMFFKRKAYPMRDLFSKNRVSKSKEKIATEGTRLKEADGAFNKYLKKLSEKYLDKEELKERDVVWDPENGDTFQNLRPNEQKQVKKDKANLEAFRNNPNRSIRFDFTPKKDNSISKVIGDLRKKKELLSSSLKAEKEALLWKINCSMASKHETDNVLREVKQKGLKKVLTWEDVRMLSLKATPQAFSKTGLNEGEAQRFLEGVADYLVKATRLQQLDFAISLGEKAEKEDDPKKKAIHTNNLAAVLEAKREYDADASHANWLWFEYDKKILLRQEQVQKLREVTETEGRELLMEAPTGFGKTKAVIPLVDDFYAGKRLIINVHPKEIEKVNTKDVKDAMATFGRKADRIEFERATDFTLESLKARYNQMQDDFKKGWALNTSPQSLRSLQLHLILALDNYDALIRGKKTVSQEEKELKVLKEECEYMMRILRAFRVEGWASIDESHVNIDPKDKLIYTIGDSTTVPLEHYKLLEECFEYLMDDIPQEYLKDLQEQEKEILHETAKKIRANEQKDIAVNDEKWRVISEYLAKRFANQWNIGPDRRIEFFNFVLGKMDNIPEWIRNETTTKRQLIALLKGQLSYVLRNCLKGKVNEKFGLSKLHFHQKEYAISYASADTPKENDQNPSQFKNPHETVNKTFLTYLLTGLKKGQAEKLLTHLKKWQQQQHASGTPYGSTEADRLFTAILGAGTGKKLKTIQASDREFYEACRHNRQAIFYYIKTIIIPQFKLYSHNLVNTTQNFRSQFSHSLSLSATPQHPAAHGPNTKAIPMEGTLGQVTHLLLKNQAAGARVHIIDVQQPRAVLERAIGVLKNNPEMRAIIDVGALLCGLSNKVVARELCSAFSKNPKIKAVQYFDTEQEKFVIMDIATRNVRDSSASTLDPSEVITFYDQSRCFGSDLQQDVNAIGLLLVDSTSNKANVGQGSGRMRKWHLDQKIEPLVTSTTKEEIFHRQQLKEGTQLTIEHLLNHWDANQRANEEETNYQSQIQEMDNEIRETAMDLLLGIGRSSDLENPFYLEDEEPDIGKAVKRLRQFSTEFRNEDTCDPWVMYAAIPTDQDAIPQLQAHLKRCLKKVKDLFSFTEIGHRRALTKRLEVYPSKWEGEEAIPLPEKVKAASENIENECEVLQEVEVEVEKEELADIHQYFQERLPSKWAEDMSLFEEGWEKPEWYSVFFNRIAQSLSFMVPKTPTAKLVCRVSLVLSGSLLAVAALAAANIAVPVIFSVALLISSIGVGVSLWKFYTEADVKYIKNCTYKVKDLMGSHLPSHLKGTARFFDNRLLVSNSFYAERTGSWKEEVQVPFSDEQKPGWSVLVIEDALDETGRDMMKRGRQQYERTVDEIVKIFAEKNGDGLLKDLNLALFEGKHLELQRITKALENQEFIVDRFDEVRRRLYDFQEQIEKSDMFAFLGLISEKKRDAFKKKLQDFKQSIKELQKLDQKRLQAGNEEELETIKSSVLRGLKKTETLLKEGLLDEVNLYCGHPGEKVEELRKILTRLSSSALIESHEPKKLIARLKGLKQAIDMKDFEILLSLTHAKGAGANKAYRDRVAALQVQIEALEAQQVENLEEEGKRRCGEGEKRVQVMLIDQNDSYYFRRRLQQDFEGEDFVTKDPALTPKVLRKLHERNASLRTRKIAVYDVQNQVLSAQGKNGFQAGELEKNTAFRQLLVQAKFLHGETDFVKNEDFDEQTYLTEHAGECYVNKGLRAGASEKEVTKNNALVEASRSDIWRLYVEKALGVLHPVEKQHSSVLPVAQVLDPSWKAAVRV